MDYREYRKAAGRHLSTCQYLLEKLPTGNVTLNSNLMQNIYYLSGYVIEMSLSYAFFAHIKHQGDVHLHKDYTAFTKDHNFDIKIRFIRANNGVLGDLPLITRKSRNAKLNVFYNEWCPDYRYCFTKELKVPDLKEDLLDDYLKELASIYKQLTQRY